MYKHLSWELQYFCVLKNKLQFILCRSFEVIQQIITCRSTPGTKLSEKRRQIAQAPPTNVLNTLRSQNHKGRQIIQQ